MKPHDRWLLAVVIVLAAVDIIALTLLALTQ